MAPVFQITFERSGGFVAAPGLVVKGTIDLKPDGTAEVRSEVAGYHRQLSSEELLRLRETLDVIDFTKLQPELRNPRAADQYQYEITFQTPDGKTQTVRVDESPASELEKSAPGLGKLADWIRREAAAIGQRRVK